MKIFRDLLLVERIKEEDESSLLVPDGALSDFSRFKVLQVGPDVKEEIKEGDIILAQNMMEPLHRMNSNLGLLLSKYAMCIDNV